MTISNMSIRKIKVSVFAIALIGASLCLAVQQNAAGDKNVYPEAEERTPSTKPPALLLITTLLKSAP